MNKIIILVLIICTSFFSYWIGAKVGFDKGWIYAQSINVNHAASDLTKRIEIKFNSIEDMYKFFDGMNRLKIKDGLIEYGRYANKFTSKLPSPIDVDDTTLYYFKKSAKVYSDQVFINKVTVESAEETVSRVEREMISDGSMDLEIWKTEKYVFLESLKEQEIYLNSAIEYLIRY